MAEIELRHLFYAYEGGHFVLSDLSASIEKGEAVGLIGANGAGKSTLLKILVGLISGYSGEASVRGLPITPQALTEIRRQVGYLFQDSENQLFLSTVYEDVAFGPRNYGYPPEEVERRVAQALQQVHLTELRDRQIYKMSGGQKKLAAIATLLSMQPEVILMDEPSIALDPRNRRNLIRILQEIPGTKVIASHDLDLIAQLCGKTFLLSEGKLVRSGETAEILADETLLLESGL